MTKGTRQELRRRSRRRGVAKRSIRSEVHCQQVTEREREKMGQMSAETRGRVVALWRTGFSVIKIRDRLLEEGVKVSRKSLYCLIKKYNECNSVADRKRAPRRRVLQNEHFVFIDETMEGNPELTSRQLHGKLIEKFPYLRVSVTVKWARRALGWSSERTRYCAMISEVNEEKRMTWCLDRIAEADLVFSDEIWREESLI